MLWQVVLHVFVMLWAPSQGKPHSLFGCLVSRWRSARPVQSHLAHSLHSVRTQFWGSQVLKQGKFVAREVLILLPSARAHFVDLEAI